MKTAVKEVITFTGEQVANVCDHTFLKRSEAYKKDVGHGESSVRRREKDFYSFLKEACESKYVPHAVCIRAEDVPHAFNFFRSRNIQSPIIAAVAGFPDGHWVKSNYKLFEVQFAMGEGAREIELVMNFQELKEGNHSNVLHEVVSVAKAVHAQRGKLKLIIETSELNEPQIIQACHIATHAGADFVKTSTGYGAFGVDLKSLEIICCNFKGGVKISGGITIDNIQQLLSCVHRVYGSDFKLDPARFRIGSCHLLRQLTEK